MSFDTTLSTYLNRLRRTIRLRGFPDVYDERPAAASGTPSPGHLCLVNSDGTIRTHNVRGGRSGLQIAIEDGLQGNTIDTAYTVGDPVRHFFIERGMEFLGRVPANAIAVAIGDYVISNGDGCVVKPTATGSLLYDNVADSAAIATTATETDFDKTYTIAANTLRVGDVIKVTGLINSIGVTATPTFRTKLYLGATAVMDTSTVSVIASDLVEFTAYILIRTIGASGTYVGFGTWAAGTPGTAVPTAFSLVSTAIDTTTTNVLKVAGKWSASSASNTAKLGSLIIERQQTTRDEAPVAMCTIAKDNSAVAAEGFIHLAAL